MLRKLLNGVAGLFTAGPPIQFGNTRSTGIREYAGGIAPPVTIGWAVSHGRPGQALIWHDGAVVGQHPLEPFREAMAYAHSLARGEPITVDRGGVIYVSPGRIDPRRPRAFDVETFSPRDLHQPETYVAKEAGAFNANDAALAGIAGSVAQELTLTPEEQQGDLLEPKPLVTQRVDDRRFFVPSKRYVAAKALRNDFGVSWWVYDTTAPKDAAHEKMRVYANEASAKRAARKLNAADRAAASA